MRETLDIETTKAHHLGTYVTLTSERARIGLIVGPGVLGSIKNKRFRVQLRGKKTIYIEDDDGFLDPIGIRKGFVLPKRDENPVFLDFVQITG